MECQEVDARNERARILEQREKREAAENVEVESSFVEEESRVTIDKTFDSFVEEESRVTVDKTFDSLDADPELAKYIAIAKEIQKENDDSHQLENVSCFLFNWC
jgi:hypothetical protein